jgi:hypothetical protein
MGKFEDENEDERRQKAGGGRVSARPHSPAEAYISNRRAKQKTP